MTFLVRQNEFLVRQKDRAIFFDDQLENNIKRNHKESQLFIKQFL
jgi:hypothetical protein